MYLGMVDSQVPFCGYSDLDTDLFPRFKNNRFQSISPILFEVSIINWMCGCIFRCHCDLDFNI